MSYTGFSASTVTANAPPRAGAEPAGAAEGDAPGQALGGDGGCDDTSRGVPRGTARELVTWLWLTDA
jgi:hypothetical protein